MKFEKTQVSNFEGAFRGMRNPLNSWDKSDSFFGFLDHNDVDSREEVVDTWVCKELDDKGISVDNLEYNESYDVLSEKYTDWLLDNECLYYDINTLVSEVAILGQKDMGLAQRLIKAGPEHMKFMRQIFVCVDITAPLYWWKEFDTYKIGTTANSTSTMHTLTSKPITMDCFEIGDYNGDYAIPDEVTDGMTHPHEIIGYLEYLRQKYLETKDKGYWKELVRWLPEAWLQTRTVTLSYANLRTIYFQRRNHKLTEWSNDFCNWIKTLPYAEELIMLEDK